MTVNIYGYNSHKSLIQDASGNHGVDQSLIAAFIQKESNFNAGATREDSGCYGLMQIKCEKSQHPLAKDLWGHISLNSDVWVKLAMTPLNAIDGGTWYIKIILEKLTAQFPKFIHPDDVGAIVLDKDIVCTTYASYNRGPGFIRHIIKSRGCESWEDLKQYLMPRVSFVCEQTWLYYQEFFNYIVK